MVPVLPRPSGKKARKKKPDSPGNVVGTGSKEISVRPGGRFSVKCDRPFRLYAVLNGKREFIGPRRVDDTFFKDRMLWSAERLFIDAAADAEWQFSDISVSVREPGGGEPVEIPVGFERPASLQEEMVRFMAMPRPPEEPETLADASDFYIEDEPEPWSPYEVQELVEDELGIPPFDQPPLGEQTSQSDNPPAADMTAEPSDAASAPVSPATEGSKSPKTV